MTDQTSLIEFPCQFPIKVMGNAHPEFEKKHLGNRPPTRARY